MIWLAALAGAIAGAVALFGVLLTSPALLIWLKTRSMDWHLWMLMEMYGIRGDLDLLSDVLSQGSLFLLGPGRFGFNLPQREALRLFLAHMPRQVKTP